MAHTAILLALVLPLCQASPIGFGSYISRDFEPPAYNECPGPRDGYYMDPYGNCGIYVECMYVGTSMEMAWVMPCIPGTRFQYPSVCEQCGKKNANDDKINIRMVPPRVSSVQQDEFDKSTPTTTISPTTPTTRPSRHPSNRKHPVTQKTTVAKQTNAMETSVDKVEKTTKGHSTGEEASTHMFTQTSGHQVSENEVTTKSLSGKTTADSDIQRTTAKDIEATVFLNVQVTSSEVKNTVNNAENVEATTTGISTKGDVHTTNKPTTGRQETEGTTANDDVQTTKDTATPHPAESETSRSAMASEEFTTTAPAAKNDGDHTTAAKVTDAKVTMFAETSESTTDGPQVRIAFESISDVPQTTGRSDESVQEQNSSNGPDKDIDSSRANVVQVTSNVIKSAQLSNLSEVVELKTAAPDLDQFTTSSPGEIS